MVDSLAAPLAGVALAAGAGTRLRPLTLERPKPLCPVGNLPLLDWALDALDTVVPQSAVNVHHGREAIEEHVERRRAGGDAVHLSFEEGRALGTAGALGNLRDWLGGRSALVVNADTVHRADLAGFVRRWDGESVSVLTSSPLPFGPRSGIVASLLPWRVAMRLPAVESGLWETVWQPALSDGSLDVAVHEGVVIDCATPTDYLRANLEVSGGASVVGDGARVSGELDGCVVWPGARVGRHEHLRHAIRTPQRTVLLR